MSAMPFDSTTMLPGAAGALGPVADFVISNELPQAS